MLRYVQTRAPDGPLLAVAADRRLAVADVRVLDGSGASAGPASTVMIENGRITSIQPGRPNDLGHDVEVLDAGGGVLSPGLIDSHIHLTGSVGHDVVPTDITPHPSNRVFRMIRDAHSALASGFTTVRHLGHGDADQAATLKQVIDERLVDGPRVLTCGWAISQSGGHGILAGWPLGLVEQLRPRSGFADGPLVCRQMVRENIAAGADWIKIYATEGRLNSPPGRIDVPNLSSAEIEAITDEAHGHGVRVAAHVTGLEGALAAVQGGVDTLEHGPHEYDAELFELMASRGVALSPTLTVFERSSGIGADLPDRPQWVTDRTRGWLESRRELVCRALELGVCIATGTDSGGPPRAGRNADEMRALVRAGLSPSAAFRAGTFESARAVGLVDHIGTVAPGKLADLVLWDRDPTEAPELADPSDIRLVIQSDVLLTRSPSTLGEHS